MTIDESDWMEESDPDMEPWPDHASLVLSTTDPVDREKLLVWWRCLPEPSNDTERGWLQVIIQKLEDTCPETIPETTPVPETPEPETLSASDALNDVLQWIGQIVDDTETDKDNQENT